MEEDDGEAPGDDADGFGDAVEGRRAAQLSATMQQARGKLMLEIWVLSISTTAWHQLTQLNMFLQAPVPTSPDDPNWELYTTHLLKFIDNELSKGIFNRSSEFLMTIASLNPALANQLISAIIAEAGMFDRDDFATLVQGGALDTPKLLVHLLLTTSPQVRQQLANELLSRWKTDEELALSQYLLSIQ